MAQATRNLNRRAVISTLAAVPALAVPAIALADPAATDKVTLVLTRDEADRIEDGLRTARDITGRETDRVNREIEAAKADPIFAAIERYQRREEDFLERCAFENVDYRTPEMVAVVDASIAAREALAATIPTTLAGISAYLDYVLANSQDQLLFEESEWKESEGLDFLRSIAAALRHIRNA